MPTRSRGPRVLVTTAAALGHFHPLAAVADALRASGADVRFVCSPAFCDRVVASGFEAVPCGIDWQSRDLSETWPDFRSVPRDERNAWINTVVWGSRLPTAMAPDLTRVVESWEPSLVLSGRAELAGPTVAESMGVPYATTSAGRVIGLGEFVSSTREGRDDLRRTLGLEPDPRGESLYRHLYMNFIPEMFLPRDDLAVPARRDLRPLAFDDPLGAAPEWLRRLDEGSVIYVTLGSILGEVRSDAFEVVVDAVSELGRTVVVTTGHGGDPRAVARRFPGVRVARYIPQRFVLDRTALVVCHGGINTVLGALSHGVPLLVLPTEQSDQRWNAEQCTRHGVGLGVDMDAIDKESVRDAVTTILGGPDFGRSAGACREEMRSLPARERAVDLLLQLAETGAP